jgi:hypothetical protein
LGCDHVQRLRRLPSGGGRFAHLKLPRFMIGPDGMKTPAAHDALSSLRPRTLDEVPERVRQIAMLRGLGYSYRQIAGPLHVTPQAISLMLARHRRALKSLRGAMQLASLSARAVNVLGRHGISTREQARQTNLLERLDRERNCGRKTLDEIARWIAEDGIETKSSDGSVDVRVA